VNDDLVPARQRQAATVKEMKADPLFGTGKERRGRFDPVAFLGQSLQIDRELDVFLFSQVAQDDRAIEPAIGDQRRVGQQQLKPNVLAAGRRPGSAPYGFAQFGNQRKLTDLKDLSVGNVHRCTGRDGTFIGRTDLNIRIAQVDQAIAMLFIGPANDLRMPGRDSLAPAGVQHDVVCRVTADLGDVFRDGLSFNPAFPVDDFYLATRFLFHF